MFSKSYNYKKLVETFLIIILAIIFDQCVKILVSKIMIMNNFSELNLLPFLNIVFVRNTGISFGMFSEGGNFGRYFFSLFSVTVGIFLIFLAILSEKKIVCYGLCLVSSGALGNAIDRIYFGGVIDFIDFFVYNFHWPSFNFADVFITIGVFLLLIDSIFYSKNDNKIKF